MLGIPLRYLVRHPAAAVKMAADPLQTLTMMQDYYHSEQERKLPQCPYVADPQWEQHLHAALGAEWPCPAAAEFRELWPQVIAELQAKGIDPGPEGFQWWNDGDAGLVRAAWCLVRHLKPKKVVETGVAHGMTSRFVLEALKRNGNGGRLWSIDLPPFEKEWRAQVGAAVDVAGADRYAGMWTYIAGSSRRKLPKLLAGLGTIDLFIHDSLHSERNVRFELERAWAAMPGRGAFLVDDADANWGFKNFTETFPVQQSMLGQAEPTRPDSRCVSSTGMFGVILKGPQA
jgi:hypothetical protein